MPKVDISPDATTERTLPEKRDVVEKRDEVLPPPTGGVIQPPGPHREVRLVKDPVTGANRKVTGRLSRAGMLHVVRSGGSFHLPDEGGIRVVSKEADVPSESELAQASGRVDEVDLAIEENDRLMSKLATQNENLKKTRASIQSKPPIEPPEADKKDKPLIEDDKTDKTDKSTKLIPKK